MRDLTLSINSLLHDAWVFLFNEKGAELCVCRELFVAPRSVPIETGLLHRISQLFVEDTILGRPISSNLTHC